MERALRALWKSDVPVGESGSWAVERFVVRDGPVRRDRLASLSGGLEYAWGPGTYTRLRRGQTVFMTDTEDEWLAHREAVLQAVRRGGRVLVTGLGLGLVVEAMLGHERSRVEQAIVIELSEDVIRLVGDHLAARHGERLRIVQGDARTWAPPPGMHFSVVWHDLWDRPTPEVFPEMERLESRYRRVCAWQGSWPRDYSKRRHDGKAEHA